MEIFHDLTRQEQIIVLFLIGAILVGGITLSVRQHRASQVEPQVVGSQSSLSQDTIFVDVKGAVWKPGVYEVEPGKRVIDVVKLANPRPDADMDALNLAALLKDQQRIFIPPKAVQGIETAAEEIPQTAGSGSFSASRVNINLAVKEQLENLPGIGPVRAQRIIEYRNAHGPFDDIDGLKQVEGIGSKIFDKIKDLVSTY